MKERITGKVEAVLIADTEDSFVTRSLPEAMLEYGGIRGDRHFGLTALADSRYKMYPRGTEIFNRRQISMVSVEECEGIAQALGLDEVKPEWLGANIVVSGCPSLTQLPMGTLFLFPSGAGMISNGENHPCVLPGRVIVEETGSDAILANKFVHVAKQRRGITGFVERTGVIRPGDTFEMLWG